MPESSQRILYITHRVPWPPDKGDRIRNWHVLRQLAACGSVKLATLADEPVPAATIDRLNKVCEEVAIEPIGRLGKSLKAAKSAVMGRSLSEGIFSSAGLRAKIESWHREAPFDAAVISASSLVAYLQNTSLNTVPAFVDVVDVDSQKWFDFAEAVPIPKRWLYRFEGNRLRNVERNLPKWAHTITLVSDAEAKLFDTISGQSCAVTATNGVDLDYYFPLSRDAEASRSGASALAFVGALDYLPNIDAACWFARDVWPTIRAESPDCELRLIGRNPAREVQSLSAIPGINVVGGVPDVRAHLADVAIVVVPMRLGRGLQNKVLEALALGKATIVSPPALAALKAVPGRDLLKAESPQEWKAAIRELQSKPDRRRELGENGRRFVEGHHDWETCLKPLTDRVRSVLNQPAAAARAATPIIRDSVLASAAYALAGAAGWWT